MANNTQSYSPSLEVLSICRSLGEIKDPNKATSISLATSLSVIITTALTFPFAVILNGLVLLAFYKNPALRRQAHVFLMALAFVDLVRITLASPSFIFKEVIYQKKLEPNCYVMVIFFNATMLAPSDMLLAAMNCERFIGLKYPIWHRVNVTKSGLAKVSFACCILGASVSLIRTFATTATQVLTLLVFGASSLTTLMFAVLIWWVIKKRNQPTRDQSGSRHCLSYQPSRPDMQGQSQTTQEGELPPSNVFQNIQQQEENPKQMFEMPQANVNNDNNSHINCTLNVSEDNPVKNPLEELDVHTDKPKDDHQTAKQQTNHPVDIHPARFSARNTNFLKSERKAAKIAIYLTIVILFSRIIPILLLFYTFDKSNLVIVAEPVVQYLSLSSALLNPLIYIGTNQHIRKSCLKF